jgi:NDP-sugar pyrophosphorylase family protein
VLVTNSDSLADLEYRAVLEAHARSGCAATLVLVPEQAGFSAVDLDRDGRVVALAGAPAVDPASVARRCVFAGVSVLEQQVLDRLPATAPSCLVRDVYRTLAAERRLNAVVHTGLWWEVGTPRSYLEGSLRLLDLPPERLRAVCAEHDPVREIDGAIAAVGPGAVLEDGARAVGHVALGFASRVSRGSTIEDSVIMPEAWIGPGGRLVRCIVGPGAELPAAFEAVEALICSDPGVDGDLGSGTHRETGLLVRPFAESGS